VRNGEALRSRFVWWTALPLLAGIHAPVSAQAIATVTPAPTTSATAKPAATEQIVQFSADQVTYDSDNDIVTATGEVRMNREGNYLAADQVIWNQKTGEVRAKGNVVAVTPEGDKIVGEDVVLNEDLSNGTIENLLVVLDNGARIAALRGVRAGKVTTLYDAVYSPCPVTSSTGCPKRPSWAITAAKVIDDPSTGRVKFEGGRLQLFGITLPLLPIFNVARGQNGATGWLEPDFSISSRTGFEIAEPYHWQLAPNRDLTITPHIYTGVLPALEAQYRDLNSVGAFQLRGFVTYGLVDNLTSNQPTDDHAIRAYFDSNGKWQFDPYWSLTTSFRVATDKTVTRRYNITNDDILRNLVNVERIDADSYLSIVGWAFEGQRSTDVQKEIPIALPLIDWWVNKDNILGGRLQFHADSLGITRIEGQDTQRAFTSVEWDLRRLTPWGQELTLTAFARGDVYHTDDAQATTVPIYSGTNGWHTRAIGALAADLKWPFIGPALGGFQRITPRVQLVLSPKTQNLDIPNEDSRSIELEDTNIWSLNRFNGYDRWEDTSRITYGFDWSLERKNVSIESTIGQSYRLTARPGIFPSGTGLTDRLSDVVGRTRIRYGSLVDLTYRFRLDKDNLAVRRTEVDLTVGTTQTYAEIGYLKLNRNINVSVEDLRDKEELQFAARILLTKYISVFGATVVDLTDAKVDPLSIADGWEPVRNRLGILYEDECLSLGVSWRRDYESVGAFHQGSTFSLSLAFKGLGR
jgi:LPS-assembly protein